MSLLAIALLLAACSPATNLSQNQQTQSPPSSNASASPSAPTTNLPDVDCSGDLPPAVEATFGEFRLAQASDFLTVIQEFDPDYMDQEFTCSVFTADFNEDSAKDYALLLVSEEGVGFRAQFALNQGNGEFTPLILNDYELRTESPEGIVYTSMDFKPAGSEGLAAREYSPLQQGTPERQTYIATPAIGLWKTIVPEDEAISTDVDISSLGYCSEAFYLVEGEVKTFTVCD